jgi:hypothetical protein
MSARAVDRPPGGAGTAGAARDLDELYVGYLPAAPPRTARWMRQVVPALVVVAGALAAVLAAAQRPSDPGVFEYGSVRSVEGTVVEQPYPMLVEAESADSASEAKMGATSLLVRPGKHGAVTDVAGLEGQRVRLDATRITSPLGSMLELVPGTIEPTAAPAATELGLATRTGPVSLIGEIVDSKCFLGVMKPGRGKPHRSCAARCISGGIPPQLLVEAADGERRLLLLANDDGSALEAAGVLDLVGEPVAADGVVERREDVLVLRVGAGGLRRADR